tara:strand:+ start:1015 stop:2013 length:999 start_codon:yes stop_codon:yes gene_type:complete
MPIRSLGNPSVRYNAVMSKTGVGALYKYPEFYWYGDRAIQFGGDTPSASNVIQYYTISSTGNSVDFGDLLANSSTGGGAAGQGRGLYSGGSGYSNVIQRVTIASTGNAVDFGDLLGGKDNCAQNAPSNGIRALWAAGAVPGGNDENKIEYTTIMGAGSASDFGDHGSNMSRYRQAGVSNKTRGIWAGGTPYSPGNQIQYVTIMTTGNSIDFGNLVTGRRSAAGNSGGTSSRGIIGGGISLTSPGSSGHYNYIDYFDIDTAGNGTDFGDLTMARYWVTGASNSTRATFFGGATLGPYTSQNRIDYVTIASTGNASDFGDALESYEKTGGCSGD